MKFFLISIFLISFSYARNERLKFSISEVTSSEEAQRKLIQDVKLHFGSDSKFSIQSKIGQFQSNRKTSAVFKSDKKACARAFLSALMSLQKRALNEGGDAVVNIKSYYYKNDFISSEKFECGAGNVIAGVTLIGDVVKLGKQ